MTLGNHEGTAGTALRPEKGVIAGEPLDRRMYFLDYIEDLNMVVCSCAKCGTTSMLTILYQRLFQQEWPFVMNQTHRDIHNIELPEWENKWRVVWNKKEQKSIWLNASSYVLIRDPVDRLISSWKSKIQCNVGPSAGDPGRALYVKQLLQLAGREDEQSCLSLEEFAEVLLQIHENGDAGLLNNHFLPQHLGCFYTYGPQMWSKVLDVKHPGSFVVLQGSDASQEMRDAIPPAHHSKGVVKVTKRAHEMLSAITANEYKMLGDYLVGPQVKAGDWV
eukprot:CAMPEP_0170594598 /NCGR_PEP_ID=MMETSP0224-20130122/14089_1 /TAXON_ID=285029 /ORGANISM="Togula jolla, Strain CCCM 725" /LENGTH=275 /DNA_ID=CAMNT_0010918673 /DNA_START=119 /DNA_END=946 /DNA_ORIENTATION=-